MYNRSARKLNADYIDSDHKVLVHRYELSNARCPILTTYLLLSLLLRSVTPYPIIVEVCASERCVMQSKSVDVCGEKEANNREEEPIGKFCILLRSVPAKKTTICPGLTPLLA